MTVTINRVLYGDVENVQDLSTSITQEKIHTQKKTIKDCKSEKEECVTQTSSWSKTKMRSIKAK